MDPSEPLEIDAFEEDFEEPLGDEYGLIEADVACGGDDDGACTAEWSLAQRITDVAVVVRDEVDRLEDILDKQSACWVEATTYLGHARLLRNLAYLYGATAQYSAELEIEGSYRAFAESAQAAIGALEAALESKGGSLGFPLPATHPALIGAIKKRGEACLKVVEGPDYQWIADIGPGDWTSGLRRAFEALDYQVARLLFSGAETPSAQRLCELISDDWVQEGAAPGACGSLVDAIAIARAGAAGTDLMRLSSVRLKVLKDLADDRAALKQGRPCAHVTQSRFLAYLDALETTDIERVVGNADTLRGLYGAIRDVSGGGDDFHGFKVVNDLSKRVDARYGVKAGTIVDGAFKAVGLGFSVINLYKAVRQKDAPEVIAKNFVDLQAAGCAAGGVLLNLLKCADESQIKSIGMLGSILGIFSGTFELVDACNNHAPLDTIVPLLKIGAGVIEVVAVVGETMGVLSAAACANLALAGNVLTIGIVVASLTVESAKELKQWSHRSDPARKFIKDLLKAIDEQRFTNVVTTRRILAADYLYGRPGPFAAVTDAALKLEFFGLQPIFGFPMEEFADTSGDFSKFRDKVQESIQRCAGLQREWTWQEEYAQRSSSEDVLMALGVRDRAQAESLLFWSRDEQAYNRAQGVPGAGWRTLLQCLFPRTFVPPAMAQDPSSGPPS